MCDHDYVESDAVGARSRSHVPPEPPSGTWVRDRYGAAFHRGDSGNWGMPGFLYLADWVSMWDARGPLVECPPWGVDPEPEQTNPDLWKEL
jgi:hypothetical protein